MYSGVTDRLRGEISAIVESETSSHHYLKDELANNLRFFNYRFPANMVSWSGGRQA